MQKIKFQIEINRVLDVLSKEIYDSPYALLRENIQNAYDAILMRDKYFEGTWSTKNDGKITVTMDNEKIIVSDNGIGMSEIVLKENYWKAGASGKKTELAMKSGVVGTFGIGGMANFGVCTLLKVETESAETKERFVSEVERANLSLSEDCISIQKITPTGEYGTTITVILDPEINFSVKNARGYLAPYIQYLPVIVELNGDVISRKSIVDPYYDNSASIQKSWNKFEHDGNNADILVQCNDVGRVSVISQNIMFSGEEINGTICLRQDVGHMWGLRNYFGLAPIPIKSVYSFGGVVNLNVIYPTAGREALSRESIDIILKLINLIEVCVTNTLAESDIINRSTSFMSHILSTGRIELADKLKIRVEPEIDMTLGELREYSLKNKYKYYEGNDESIIKSFGTPDSPLVILSRSYPRRKLEASYINKFCNVELITDAPRILSIYPRNLYELHELSFIVKAKNILETVYAVQNVDINIADLTHNLSLYIQYTKKNKIEIFIQKNHPTIQPVMQSYYTSYDVFPGFIQDYIRTFIYPKIKDWVPSSTREGAEALQKILRQKKELYIIGLEDVGLTSVVADYMAGKANFENVIKTANILRKVQTQEIRRGNIGSLETEIPDLVSSPIQETADETRNEVVGIQQVIQSAPPILRMDVVTEKKLLVWDKQNPLLNNFRMFLAISDRAFREEYDFFITPHKTRIIWGGHRIIFIFTHASERFSLYYDVELKEDVGDLAGGSVFYTTTIITKNRIFIPVPDTIRRFFEVAEGKKEFYVRYDTISS